MTDQLNEFAQLITKEQQEDLRRSNLACEANMTNAIASVKLGQKYAKVDIGSSGRYMIEMSTGRIYGIKGYGVVHRGYYFGTLDTINEYHWGRYYAGRKETK